MKKDTVKFSISCDRNWKRMTRPRFADVVREVWTQLDDLGHDLEGAIIMALPKGASPRQVVKALREIEQQQYDETHERSLDEAGAVGTAIRKLTAGR